MTTSGECCHVATVFTCYHMYSDKKKINAINDYEKKIIKVHNAPWTECKQLFGFAYEKKKFTLGIFTVFVCLSDEPL